MRLNLDLEELHVETAVMQPEYEDFDLGGNYAASVLYNTLTEPIERPNTRSSPCVA